MILQIARALAQHLCAIWTMHGRKPPVPSCGLAIQVDTELSVVDASQSLECLVKEYVSPRLDALILKAVRYATKYLDTTGTLGSSIPDFEWGRRL